MRRALVFWNGKGRRRWCGCSWWRQALPSLLLSVQAGHSLLGRSVGMARRWCCKVAEQRGSALAWLSSAAVSALAAEQWRGAAHAGGAPQAASRGLAAGGPPSPALLAALHAFAACCGQHDNR